MRRGWDGVGTDPGASVGHETTSTKRPMIAIRSLTVFALISTVLVLPGCSDPIGPQVTVGTYQMRYFRGEGLPATSTDGTLFVRSGTLELKAGNRFVLEMDTDHCLENVCTPNPIRHEGAFAAQNGFLSMDTGSGLLNGRHYADYLIIDDDTPGSLWVLVE